jgi:YVTN family beta-propeller protein
VFPGRGSPVRPGPADGTPAADVFVDPSPPDTGSGGGPRRPRASVRVERPAATRQIRGRLSGPLEIAVCALKGGVGKTTVAACLGLALADHREGRVIVLDADPNAGTLSDRLTGGAGRTVRQLLDDIERVDSAAAISRYTGELGRLHILAGERDPALGEELDRAGYERICALLTRHYDIVVNDCGTGLAHPTADAASARAGGLVVVGTPTVDGAGRAARTLDWLEEHGHAEKAADAVVALCCDRTSERIDRERLVAHFAGRCRAVVEIPHDPMLAVGGRIDPSAMREDVRQAFIELGAQVVRPHLSSRQAPTERPRRPANEPIPTPRGATPADLARTGRARPSPPAGQRPEGDTPRRGVPAQGGTGTRPTRTPPRPSRTAPQRTNHVPTPARVTAPRRGTAPGPWGTPPGRKPPAPRRRTGGRGRRLLVAAGVAVALLAGGLAGYAYLTHRPSPPTTPTAAPPPPDTAATAHAPPARPTVARSVPVPSWGTPIAVGPTPGFVAVAPDGQRAYVANRDAKVITVVDTLVNRVIAKIPVAAGPPQFIAFAPDGRKAYVSIFNDRGTIATIGVLDTATNQIVATVPVRTRPFASAVTRDGSRLYVPNHDSGTVSIIDTATNAVIKEIKVAPNPHWIDMSRDGTRAYIANHESNLISVLDLATDRVIAEVRVQTSPHSVAVHPSLPLVANVNYDSSSVSFIDTNTNRVVATVPVGRNPQAIAWSSDGRFAYTANVGDGTVSVIDAETHRVTATIPTGTSPTSVAVVPDGRTGYVTNLDSQTLSVLHLNG